jgi:serine/threonine protein kinase/tetratricopeptide (TPR) repeat protein
VITLGPFELVRRIGAGATSDVWQAVHTGEGLPVAVKVVTARDGPDPRFRRLFAQEVRAVARLYHPGIIRLFDYGELPAELPASLGLPAEAPYCVMEWVAGGSLATQGGRLGYERIREILLALLDALAHAHARGVVHRDLKPDNVLMADRGPVLTDFGVAARLDEAEGLEPQLVGTPNYMSPEQIRGSGRDLGPWTDLYALGCLACFLVAGQPPFAGREQLGVLRGHLKEAPPLPQRADVPEGFGDFLRRLLAKDPAQRFRYAADAARALHALGGEEEVGFEATRFEEVGSWTLTSGQPLEITAERTSPGRMVPVPSEPRPPVPASWRARTALPPPPPRGAGSALIGLREVALQGREEERDFAWAELLAAGQGDGPRLLLIEGPSGCGKSRLAGWLAERAHELGVAATLQATHEEIAGPASGLGPMLARYFRCTDLSAEERAARIGEGLGLPPDEDLPRALAAAMDVGREFAGDEARLILGPESERHGAVARGLGRLATQRPLVVHLDDLQWGADTVHFIEKVLGDPHAWPVLLVGTVRTDAPAHPEARAGLTRLTTRPRTRMLPLGPLQPEAIEAISRGLLPLDAAGTRLLVRQAGGNPFFAEALLRHWLRSEALEAAPDGFRVRDPAASLPDGLATILVQRLDEALGTDPADTIAFELAAALGQVVDDGVWRAACAHALAPATPATFERMQDAGLVRVEDERHFAFTHATIAEALRRRAQDAGRWAILNVACAAVLRDRPDVEPERLAEHLVAAGELDAALERLSAAARSHLRRADYAAASRALVRRATLLRQGRVPRNHPAWVETRTAWAERATGQADFEGGRRHAMRAVAQARALGDDRLLARALVQQGEAVRRLGGAKAGWESFWEAVRVVRGVGDPELEGRVRLKAGQCQGQLGHLDEATQMLTLALRRLAPVHVEARGEALFGLAAVAWQAGETERAQRFAMDALAHHRRAGTRFGIATVLSLLGDIARHGGRLDEAEACFRESLRLVEATGAAGRHIALCNVALVLVDRGVYAEAHDLLEEALRRSQAAHHVTASAMITLALMVCEAEAGDFSRWELHFRGMAMLREGLVTTSEVAWHARRLARLADAAGQRACAEAAWALAIYQFEALGRGTEAVAAREEWSG